VIARLLDEWGDQIAITKEAIDAAARNSGKLITLRSRVAGRLDHYTKEVVKATARNSENGNELMALNLESKGKKGRLAPFAIG
jgi:hypothetical protein